ncbi:MAG: hypothetical protein WEC84_01790 [Candidatus Andersenbacteria bacterium]
MPLQYRLDTVENEMIEKFTLKLIGENDEKTVFFANNTDDFVEVVLAIDGQEIKTGQMVSPHTRGYCYPPRYQRAIAKMKTGEPLPFKSAGIIRATVFAGSALRKEEELDVPAFIWKKLPKKTVRFTRDGSQPIAVLEQDYSNEDVAFSRKAIR